ncbi:MAG: hypothetical protein AAGK25_06390 [Pseudomonadota bacterium]
MYLRFITPRRAYGAVRGDMRAAGRQTASGLFQTAGSVARDSAQPLWLRRSLREQFDWFNAELPIPTRKGIVTRRSNRAYAGLCWFRDGLREPKTQEAVYRANLIACLLREADIPVTRIKTRNPGQIVYHDPMQVVAIPNDDLNLTWH